MKEEIKHYSKRLNQVLLCFPVWLTLGITGKVRKEQNTTGWSSKEPVENYEKMY